jgi:hypothetical protein
VAPDPDKWLTITMRTVSAGGGHGPILLGKSEAGGGGQLRRPRDLLIPTLIYRENFYIEEIFYIGHVKISDFGKKVQLIWNL